MPYLGLKIVALKLVHYGGGGGGGVLSFSQNLPGMTKSAIGRTFFKTIYIRYNPSAGDGAGVHYWVRFRYSDIMRVDLGEKSQKYASVPKNV